MFFFFFNCDNPPYVDDSRSKVDGGKWKNGAFVWFVIKTGKITGTLHSKQLINYLLDLL